MSFSDADDERGDNERWDEHADDERWDERGDNERWDEHADDERWDERSDGYEELEQRRWPLTWRGLYPRERWLWFEQLWSDVCMLRDRYRLMIRAGWWEDELQVEALAALAAWAARYDDGEWDDPPGKLALLFDLERVAALLRDGAEPFQPDRDRPAFTRHLLDSGCQPPQASQ